MKVPTACRKHLELIKGRNWSSWGSHLSIVWRSRCQCDPQSVCVARVAVQHTQSPRAALVVPPLSLPVAQTQEEGEDPKWEATVEAAGGTMGDCWDVLGMIEILGCKKGVIAAEKKLGRSKQMLTSTAGLQALLLAASLPRAHCPQMLWPTGSASPHSLQGSALSGGSWDHISVFVKPPLSSSPSCLLCPPPALLRGGRHSFPSCESSSPAISLLCQVIASLRGEPWVLPALLSLLPAAYCWAEECSLARGKGCSRQDPAG